MEKKISGGEMSGDDICTKAKNQAGNTLFAIIIIGFDREADNMGLALTLVISILYTFGW